MHKRPLIIGVTGSLGMGKSTLTRQMTAFGARICSADNIVHALLAKGGAAVKPVAAMFPEAVKNGAVDRAALGNLVFKNKDKLKRLEAVLHPLVVMVENDFIEKEGRKGAKMVVLDIPLLFETGAETRCDMVIVASAPSFIQKQRALARPGMTPQKFSAILASQLSNEEKKKRADIVIPTGLGKAYSFRKLSAAIRGMHAT